jgi:hypothetical protein
VSQQRAQSAGRPGSALLILVAIFATAVFLRVPIGPRTAEPLAESIDARVLNCWAALPTVSMDRPALDTLVARRAVPLNSTPVLEPIPVTRLASPIEMATPETSPQRPSAGGAPPPAVPEPALASTAHSGMTGLARPVAQESYVESTSGPFGVVGGAVGTALVKTGAALSLAFKKTGQGILAPF